MPDSLELVEHALRNHIDPSADDDYAIRMASANGHDEIVELLLKDNRTDPKAYDDYAIRMASFHGHDKIVELLLKDGRADSSLQWEQ